MELLEQVHRDERQQAVLGRADGVALVASGDGLVLLLEGPVASIHRPALPADPLRRAFVRQAIGGGVPASPGVAPEQLLTAMPHPVEPLHLHGGGGEGHNGFILQRDEGTSATSTGRPTTQTYKHLFLSGLRKRFVCPLHHLDPGPRVSYQQN